MNKKEAQEIARDFGALCEVMGVEPTSTRYRDTTEAKIRNLEYWPGTEEFYRTLGGTWGSTKRVIKEELKKNPLDTTSKRKRKKT